jgi:hypothetical protein
MNDGAGLRVASDTLKLLLRWRERELGTSSRLSPRTREGLSTMMTEMVMGGARTVG